MPQRRGYAKSIWRRNAMRNHGEKVDDGYELHFEDDEPIIAGYLFDEPCDIIIKAVKVDKDGYLTILGEDKQDRSEVHEIDEDEFFAKEIHKEIRKLLREELESVLQTQGYSVNYDIVICSQNEWGEI